MNNIYFDNYDPADHYWKHQDSNLAYGSRRGLEIDVTTDETYREWALANWPTPYPLDEFGEESPDELRKVLAPYGLKLYPLTLLERIEEIQGSYNLQLENQKNAYLSAQIMGNSEQVEVLKQAYGAALEQMSAAIQAALAEEDNQDLGMSEREGEE